MLHYEYWILTGTPLRYHVAALCCGGPVFLNLQVWPLHMLQKLIDGMGAGVSQLIALNLDLGGSLAGQPASSPTPSSPVRVFHHCPY